MNHGNFPIASDTIVVHTVGASEPVTGLKRGIRYRVVADVDSYLQYGADAASVTGMYLPAKVPEIFMFGESDSQGTDLVVNVFSAGAYVFFTPIVTVYGD